MSLAERRNRIKGSYMARERYGEKKEMKRAEAETNRNMDSLDS